MKNIFICHRPYHILRCCDIILNDKNLNNNYENILFTFDVKLEKSTSFQKFESHAVFYPFFDEVIELPRNPDPSVRSVLALYDFCRRRRSEYLYYVERFKDVDSIFFFADNELEVELLVGLFREKNPNTMSILVDEGLITYSLPDHDPSWKRRVWLRAFKYLLNIKYFNTELTYGYSNVYNKCLANNPEKAIFFHGVVEKLPPLSEMTCGIIRSKLTNMNVPDYTTPYFIYIGTYEKPFEDDLPVLQELRNILNNYGINFYIKLHPQQNEELYKKHFGESVMLEKGVPVELFFGHNAIMGGTISSSLFNASLQGYKAIDFSYLFSEEKRRKWAQLPITEQFDWIDVIPIKTFEQFDAFVKSFIESNNFKE